MITAEQMAYVGHFFEPNPQQIAVDGFLAAVSGVPPLAKDGNTIAIVGLGNGLELPGSNALALVGGPGNSVQVLDANAVATPGSNTTTSGDDC